MTDDISCTFPLLPEILHNHATLHLLQISSPWVPENVFTCPVHFQDQGHKTRTTHFNTT